jgi:phage terminase large subunit-like protein
MPEWVKEPHLQEIERVILDMYMSDTKNNLILQIPLGMGKTTYICKLLALNLLIHNPDEQIILATYLDAFSAEQCSWVRDRIEQYGKKFNVEVDPSWSQKGFFRIKGRKGSMRGVGVGSKFGGADATTLLVDDLFSSPVDALSQALRSSVELWWSGQLQGRKRANPVHAPKTILIGTAKHPEEISCKLEASNANLPTAEKWIIHKMPAIKEDGTSICPTRFPLEKLLDIKARYESLNQSYLWDTLYQLNPQLSSYLSFLPEWLPQPGEKSKLSHIDLWYDATLRPWLYQNTVAKLVACDPSISGSGDFTAIGTMHIVKQNDSLHLYLDKHFRKQCVIPEVREALSTIVMRDQPDAASCEANGFQRIIAWDANNATATKGFFTNIRPFEPPKNLEFAKSDIAGRLSDILAEGRLHLFDCPENVALRAELVSFPHGEHDDSADMIRQAVHLANAVLFGQAT